MGTLYRAAGRTIWSMKYYKDGKAVYESSGTSVKDEARDQLKIREGAIANGEQIAGRAGRQMTFDTAFKAVEDDYLMERRRSIDDLKRRVKLHLLPRFRGKRLRDIDEGDVRDYMAARIKAGAKPATVNREAAIIKRAFRLTASKTKLRPPSISMLEERNIRTGFFEREQFDALCKYLPAPWPAVMAFAFFTGWRIRSEVLTLTWANVDENTETVTLAAGTTKNGEGRTFPYGGHPELRDVIIAQKARQKALQARGVMKPWVFADDSGDRLPAFYSELWRAACKAAGCPGRIPHDFRRTAVRNLIRAGVPETTAMTLTGHMTREVFKRYDIVNEADLRSAVTMLAQMATTKRKRRA